MKPGVPDTSSTLLPHAEQRPNRPATSVASSPPGRTPGAGCPPARGQTGRRPRSRAAGTCPSGRWSSGPACDGWRGKRRRNGQARHWRWNMSVRPIIVIWPTLQWLPTATATLTCPRGRPRPPAAWRCRACGRRPQWGSGRAARPSKSAGRRRIGGVVVWAAARVCTRQGSHELWVVAALKIDMQYWRRATCA